MTALLPSIEIEFMAFTFLQKEIPNPFLHRLKLMS